MLGRQACAIRRFERFCKLCYKKRPRISFWVAKSTDAASSRENQQKIVFLMGKLPKHAPFRRQGGRSGLSVVGEERPDGSSLCRANRSPLGAPTWSPHSSSALGRGPPPPLSPHP